jgi:uncharacterized membrane protein (DUF2068 family)
MFEASKGFLALLAGSSVLSLAYGGAQQAFKHLIEWLALDPAQGYPRLFLSTASSMKHSTLVLLISGGLAYALMRFIEAYGLWFGRRWAEWFAALSGAIYIPFELYKVVEGVDWVGVSVLAVNVLIVGYMSLVLYRSRTAQRALASIA